MWADDEGLLLERRVSGGIADFRGACGTVGPWEEGGEFPDHRPGGDGRDERCVYNPDTRLKSGTNADDLSDALGGLPVALHKGTLGAD